MIEERYAYYKDSQLVSHFVLLAQEQRKSKNNNTIRVPTVFAITQPVCYFFLGALLVQETIKNDKNEWIHQGQASRFRTLLGTPTQANKLTMRNDLTLCGTEAREFLGGKATWAGSDEFEFSRFTA